MNPTSVGIEFVRKYDDVNLTWDAVTPRQAVTGRYLVEKLMLTYNLSPSRVYAHEVVAAKTPGEGAEVKRAMGF